MTGDPYRDASGLRCPRCGGVLVEDDRAEACGNGCGDWMSHARSGIPREAFDKRVDNGAVWWTLGTGDGAKCPRCTRPMMTYGTLYEYCASHGAWVDARQRNNFRAHFAQALRRPERVAEIVAEVAADPAALAARIARLEYDVQWLRARVEELERKR